MKMNDIRNPFLRIACITLLAGQVILPAGAHESEIKIAFPGYRPLTGKEAGFIETVAASKIALFPSIIRVVQPAEGRVTLGDKRPLPGGWIEFQLAGDAAAPTAKAKIQPDGRFRLGTYAEADGAVEGTHRVLVLPPLPPFVNPDSRRRPPRPDPDRYPRINPKYRRFDTSGLVFSVTPEPSENRFEIRLEE